MLVHEGGGGLLLGCSIAGTVKTRMLDMSIRLSVNHPYQVQGLDSNSIVQQGRNSIDEDVEMSSYLDDDRNTTIHR